MRFEQVRGSATVSGQGGFAYDAGTVIEPVARSDYCCDFEMQTWDIRDITTDPQSSTTTITVNGDWSITADFGAMGTPCTH